MQPYLEDVERRTAADGVNSQTGEAVSPTGCTMLSIACTRGKQEMVLALLKLGASRSARDSLGYTPLHRACRNGHLSCAISLITARPRLSVQEINAAGPDGFTALHIAAFSGHDKVAKVLVDAGARLDAVIASDDGGVTPLALALHLHPLNAELRSILSQGPASSASGDPAGLRCDECGRTAAAVNTKLMVCSRCHSAIYCSMECQKAAWPGHKVDCKRRGEELGSQRRIEQQPTSGRQPRPEGLVPWI